MNGSKKVRGHAFLCIQKSEILHVLNPTKSQGCDVVCYQASVQVGEMIDIERCGCRKMKMTNKVRREYGRRGRFAILLCDTSLLQKKTSVHEAVNRISVEKQTSILASSKTRCCLEAL